MTAIPGTTRDVIEVHLDLAGYLVTLLDTAGIRETDDPAEREGVRRARARAASADLVLWVTDAAEDARNDSQFDICQTSPLTWSIRNKIDLVDSDSEQFVRSRLGSPSVSFDVSAITGVGLDELIGALVGFARDNFGAGDGALITRERHRHALTETAKALERASSQDVGAREEVIAEELRLAATALGRLTGRVDVEDILDRIFRDFCIGK